MAIEQNLTLALRAGLDGDDADALDWGRHHLGPILTAPGPVDASLAVHRSHTTDLTLQVNSFDEVESAFVPVGGQPPNVRLGLSLFELIASVNPSLAIKVGVQWGLFAGAIANLGTDKHHAKYFPLLRTAEGFGCFAMTETGHGSNVQGLGTTATYDPATGEFVVHTPAESAEKNYIGNAARDGRFAVVFAQLLVAGENHGVHALVVPIRGADMVPLPGITITDDGRKGGLNGVDNGRLSFDHVRVPREELLDRFGSVDAQGVYTSPIPTKGKRFFTMIGTLIRGRVAVARGANGAAKTALAIAVQYGLTRRQFGEPGEPENVLLDYSLHQSRLLVPLAKVIAVHFALSKLAGDLVDAQTRTLSDVEQRKLEARVAGLKALATDLSHQVLDEARQCCGGAGFLEENQITRLKADVDIDRTFEGDNPVLRLLVARSLLTDYKQGFEQRAPLQKGMLVGQQLLGNLGENTPFRSVFELARSVRRRPNADEALRQKDHLLQFADWEKHVTSTLAQRLRAGTPLNAVQLHAIEAAKAHTDRLVLEAFVEGIARVEDPEAAALLGKVCDLYAAATRLEIGTELLEHGLMGPQQSKDNKARIAVLCAELRPYAGQLVHALAVPDAWITAPIAKRDAGEPPTPVANTSDTASRTASVQATHTTSTAPAKQAPLTRATAPLLTAASRLLGRGGPGAPAQART